jgi:predicted DNA-binding protein with PD1-like motif
MTATPTLSAGNIQAPAMNAESALPGVPMQAITLRLPPQADLKPALLEYCADQGIEAACVLSAVGSLWGASIRYAGRKGSCHSEGKMEIVSLSGTLSRHGCHLHIAVADGRGRVTGGHLMEGCRIRTTAEIVLGLLPGVGFERIHDPETGHRELHIRDLPLA